MLNAATRKIWAKSSGYENGQPTVWLPLYLHLMDAMGVAEKCLESWVNPMQYETLMRQEKGRLSKEAVSALACFLVGAHDIGKASPPFSGKVPLLNMNVVEEGFENPPMSSMTRSSLKHGLVGATFLTDYLKSRGWRKQSATEVASVVGGHHGIPASHGELANARRAAEMLGQDRWNKSRTELLDWLVRRSGLEQFEEELSSTLWTQAALVVLEGLTVISDWIASNDRYFPIFPLQSSEPETYLNDEDLFRTRLERGWNMVNISPTWRASDLSGDADDVVRRRFGLGPDAVARPLQACVLDVAREMDAPGILLIEDVMGAGKTEAGLLAAEILAERCGASGLLMVLPTQSTTDSMFARVKSWVESGRDNPGSATMALVHGKAQMNELYQHMEFTNSYSAWDFGFDTDTYTPSTPEGADSGLSAENKAMRSPWMSGKKSLLSEIVVSTIDQLLMVALRSRYLALRHMGISRKVVVIDEIHAADVYMREYLYMALEWLGAYGVPVVALSATLTPSIRDEITEAYARGKSLREDSNVGKTRIKCHLHTDPEEKAELPYPVLTYTSGRGTEVTELPRAFPSTRVLYDFIKEQQIPHLVNDLLCEGGCLLVVRNTVKAAQASYKELQQVFGEDVRLVHARFMAKDRVENDKWLLDHFGKPGSGSDRPKRKIVVATQVVEQSLDLDFDAIITDLAPIDLVFQRIGRVHRHRRVRPKPLREPKCFLVDVPELYNEAPQELRAIKWNVYEPSLLLRTAEILRLKEQGALVIPDEIPRLTYEVFDGSKFQNSFWDAARLELDQKAIDAERARKMNAKTFMLRSPADGRSGLTNWLDASRTDDDSRARAAVRDGEDSLEVLLVEDEGEPGNPIWKVFDLIGDNAQIYLPMNAPLTDEDARLLAQSSVRLPAFASNPANIDKVLDELSFHIDEWQQNRLVAGQLILPMVNGETVLAGRRLMYTRERGLEEVNDD